MNATCYIFGQLGDTYTQYPNDDARTIFSACRRHSEQERQLVVHRQGGRMFYTFLQRIVGKGHSYVGLSIMLSGVYIVDLKSMYSQLKFSLDAIATRGLLLDFEGESLIPCVKRFEPHGRDIEPIFAMLQKSMDSFSDSVQRLPVADYGIPPDSVGRFSLITSSDAMIEAMQRYAFIVMGQDLPTPPRLGRLANLMRMLRRWKRRWLPSVNKEPAK